jgi:hypothetical protein
LSDEYMSHDPRGSRASEGSLRIKNGTEEPFISFSNPN